MFMILLEDRAVVMEQNSRRSSATHAVVAMALKSVQRSWGSRQGQLAARCYLSGSDY